MQLKWHSRIVCLPQTKLLWLSPPPGTSKTCCFSLHLSTKTNFLCALTCTQQTPSDMPCKHTHAHNISCESSLIELTLQLRACFTRFLSKMEDWGWNKCWGSRRKEANAAHLLRHYETTGSLPPVFLHNLFFCGLREIEERYSFLFILSSSQLIPWPSTLAPLMRKCPATYFQAFIKCMFFHLQIFALSCCHQSLYLSIYIYMYTYKLYSFFTVDIFEFLLKDRVITITLLAV